MFANKDHEYIEQEEKRKKDFPPSAVGKLIKIQIMKNTNRNGNNLRKVRCDSHLFMIANGPTDKYKEGET